MTERLDFHSLVKRVSEADPLQSKRLRKHLDTVSDAFVAHANNYLVRYVSLLEKHGLNVDFSVQSYLRMCHDYRFEALQFMRSGEYSCKSFADACARVYDDPNVMTYYMHALILSNFLWPHHYRMWEFILKNLPNYNRAGLRYLEVGGGHGLFLAEALRCLPQAVQFTMIDVSQTSVDMARNFVDNPEVDYKVQDVFAFAPEQKFDFITMGEVLEHVEEPLRLLQHLHSLIANGGHLFITVPTNAPAIDHITLFGSADEIRNLVHQAGFTVVKDASFVSEDLDVDEAERRKIATLYGGFLAASNYSAITK